MSFDELRQVRVEKLENLKKAGINPFPAKVEFSATEIAIVKKDFSKHLKSKKGTAITGRIMGKSEHGNASFLYKRKRADHRSQRMADPRESIAPATGKVARPPGRRGTLQEALFGFADE